MEKTYDIIYSMDWEVHTQMRVEQSKINSVLFTIKNLGGRLIGIYESSDNKVKEFID